MKSIFNAIVVSMFTFSLHAQEVFEIDIPIADICQEEMNLQLTQTEQKTPVVSCVDGAQSAQPTLGNLNSLLSIGFMPSFDPLASKQSTCASVLEMSKQNPAPYELIKKDIDGNTWKLRFHFGFTRTNYGNTDLHLKSDRLDVVIKDFEFQERTSAEFYNPANWKSFQNAFQWIDEPTNTFTFSLEKNKNAFYLTVFHPKFLKNGNQNKHVTGTVDGVAVDKVMPISEEFDGYNNQPGEMHLTRFQNTHKQMDWQIGYGRKFTIFDSPKAGSLNYIPRVDVGISSGRHLTVYVKEGHYWEFDDFEDKDRIHAFNASIGHRLEYQKGRFGVFADQKLTVGKYSHGFMDQNGTATYNMMYSPTTFGVSFDLYQFKKK